MKPELKKLLVLNLPYLLFVYLFAKCGQAYRLAAGVDASAKLLHLTDGISAAFANPLPSLHPFDLCVGVVGAVAVRLIVYSKGKNAKKYRKGKEYGRIYRAIDEILSQMKDETLTFKFRRQINRLKYDEIEYVESQARVCHIFATNNRCFVTTCKLNDLEEKLSDKRFLRCHQSYLVNMDHIQSAGDNFIMDSGDVVRIRQNGAKEIKEKYENYIMR